MIAGSAHRRGVARGDLRARRLVCHGLTSGSSRSKPVDGRPDQRTPRAGRPSAGVLASPARAQRRSAIDFRARAATPSSSKFRGRARPPPVRHRRRRTPSRGSRTRASVASCSRLDRSCARWKYRLEATKPLAAPQREPRGGVERVALPLQPPVAELLEGVSGEQVDRLHVRRDARQRVAERRSAGDLESRGARGRVQPSRGEARPSARPSRRIASATRPASSASAVALLEILLRAHRRARERTAGQVGDPGRRARRCVASDERARVSRWVDCAQRDALTVQRSVAARATAVRLAATGAPIGTRPHQLSTRGSRPLTWQLTTMCQYLERYAHRGPCRAGRTARSRRGASR